MDRVAPALDSCDNSVTLMVKEKERTLRVTTSLKKTVAEFRDELVEKHLGDAAKGQRVRLISSGKMLKAEQTLASYGLNDGAFVLCALSAPPVVQPPARSTVDALVNDLNLGGDQAQGGVGAQRRGFDRLVELGLTDDEIVAMRAHFYPHVLEYSARQPEVAGEDAADRVYRMEAEWIHLQGPDSEFGQSQWRRH